MRRWIIAALLVLCAASAWGQTYNANWYVPYTNEAACIYLMREGSGSNVTDYSANGRTATNRNSPVWAERVSGAGALAYDGDTALQWTDIGNLGITGAITIAYWQQGNNTNGGSASANCTAVGNSGASVWSAIGYQCMQKSSDYTLGMWVGNNGSSAGDSATIATNLVGWNHLVMTYDPGVAILIYKNATIIKSQAVTRTWVNLDPHPWVIARDQRAIAAPSNDDYYWGGLLGEVMIVARAFTPAQVTELYNSFTSTPPATVTGTKFSTVQMIYNLTTRGSIQ